FFEAPTVAGLAERIESARRASLGVPAAPIMPASPEGDLPLSCAQERLWFLHQLDPHTPVYNVPLALRLEGPLHLAALRQALVEIVRSHETLRTTISSN